MNINRRQALFGIAGLGVITNRPVRELIANDNRNPQMCSTSAAMILRHSTGAFRLYQLHFEYRDGQWGPMWFDADGTQWSSIGTCCAIVYVHYDIPQECKRNEYQKHGAIEIGMYHGDKGPISGEGHDWKTLTCHAFGPLRESLCEHIRTTGWGHALDEMDIKKRNVIIDRLVLAEHGAPTVWEQKCK